MVMTGYKGVNTFPKAMPFQGGLCQWWYTPVENVALWPEVSPLTQKLRGEPQLNPTAVWYGPIKVSDKNLGFTETQDFLKGLPYYKTKVEGVMYGAVDENHINLENMPYHKYVIVGKSRAGGMYLVIGSALSPLDFVAIADTGKGGNEDEFSTKISFAGESLPKAFLFDYFSKDQQQLPQKHITTYTTVRWGYLDSPAGITVETIEALLYSKETISGETIVVQYPVNDVFTYPVYAELLTEPVKIRFTENYLNGGAIADLYNILNVAPYRIYVPKVETIISNKKIQFLP